jgi:small GTP-binding protein
MEASSLKFKVCLIGSAQVGKTSLLRRILGEEQFPESYEPTVGVNFVSKAFEVSDQTVRFQFWDTAGAERYRSLLNSYLRGSQCFLAVYDITNSSSFEDLKRILASRDSDSEQASRAIVFLLGNKYDLSEASRQVSADEVREYAKENGYLFNEISVKSSINTDEILQVISEEVLSVRAPSSGRVLQQEASSVVQLPKLKTESRSSSRNAEFKSNSALLMANPIVCRARHEIISARSQLSEVNLFCAKITLILVN